jgi:hypothetical protein
MASVNSDAIRKVHRRRSATGRLTVRRLLWRSIAFLIDRENDLIPHAPASLSTQPCVGSVSFIIITSEVCF